MIRAGKGDELASRPDTERGPFVIRDDPGFRPKCNLALAVHDNAETTANVRPLADAEAGIQQPVVKQRQPPDPCRPLVQAKADVRLPKPRPDAIHEPGHVSTQLLNKRPLGRPGFDLIIFRTDGRLANRILTAR